MALLLSSKLRSGVPGRAPRSPKTQKVSRQEPTMQDAGHDPRRSPAVRLSRRKGRSARRPRGHKQDVGGAGRCSRRGPPPLRSQLPPGNSRPGRAGHPGRPVSRPSHRPRADRGRPSPPPHRDTHHFRVRRAARLRGEASVRVGRPAGKSASCPGPGVDPAAEKRPREDEQGWARARCASAAAGNSAAVAACAPGRAGARPLHRRPRPHGTAPVGYAPRPARLP